MLDLEITNETLALRQVNELDGELLFQIFSSTREKEMQMVSFWTDEQKNMFLRQQFMAQHNYYQHTFTQSNFWIIEQHKIPIGRLYFDTEQSDYFKIIDISILAKHRGKGIGEGILRDILSVASAKNKVVRIHVENHNPAKRLYEKIGFKTIEIGDIYSEMEWKLT
jgi:ribosomal protein S18 acetylase RimI-like enzyme